MVTNAKRKANVNMRTRSTLDPIYIIEKVRELCGMIHSTNIDDEDMRTNATALFLAYLRSSLASKRVIKVQKLLVILRTLLSTSLCHRSIV